MASGNNTRLCFTPSLDGKPYTSILYANGPGYYSNLRNFTKDNITYYEARANLADPKEKFNISKHFDLELEFSYLSSY